MSHYTNRLINEKSPYLLQNAYNPVDWYPWGQEAFDLAKKLDKPIFLSIGYATCHWCHVMEKESFQNVELAALMNETFVNIKVDREELPQVDSIYMEFAQALMSSSGGWPLHLVLTPDLKPFFAATYLPPTSRRGVIGMDHFIRSMGGLWASEDRQHLIDQAEKIVKILEHSSPLKGEELPNENTLTLSLDALYWLIDPIYGGLKGKPKFPWGYQSIFLMEWAKLKEDSRALFCAQLSLDRMRQGGIWDHLGGGFSRYSVDEKWVVPHFEKMLYDNAILASAYLCAWKYLKKENYKKVCEQILSYILNEMSHPEGGFYSAEDADSEGQEGKYYTWSTQEIKKNLSEEEARIFCLYYGFNKEPNFENRYVLHAAQPLEEFAEIYNLSVESTEKILSDGRKKLLNYRQNREHPFKDDKILVSWNGLMIDAMARAFSPLQNTSYKEAAIRSAEFVRNHLWQEGRLLRRWREGEARFLGGLCDYAFLIKGVLSLFEEGCGSHWLEWAMQLSNELQSSFKVDEGAFFSHREDPSMLVRKCEYYDGAEPSGNSVHAENLLRLYQLTQEGKYLIQAEDVIKAAKPFVESYPPGACYHLLCLHRYLNQRAPTIVIALDEKESLKEEMQQILSARFVPHLGIIWKKSGDHLLTTLIPSLIDKNPIDGQTAIYICRQSHCEAPLSGEQQIFRALETL